MLRPGNLMTLFASIVLLIWYGAQAPRLATYDPTSLSNLNAPMYDAWVNKAGHGCHRQIFRVQRVAAHPGELKPLIRL
jgi:hypothetical protein